MKKFLHLFFTVAIIATFSLVANPLLAVTPYDSNLLINPRCDNNDFEGWTKTIHNWVASDNMWTSGNTSSTMKQSVDLLAAGFTAAQLDASPFLLGSGSVKLPHSGYRVAIARIKVNLLDASNSIIQTLKIEDNTLQVSTSWRSHTKQFQIPVGTRKAEFYFEGQDAVNWFGNFGPMFDHLWLSLSATEITNATNKAVVCASVDNGSFSVDKTTAAYNESVQITANPATNYGLKNFIVKEATGATIDVTEDGTFTMPFGHDVTVSGVFWKTGGYSISCASVDNGSFTVDKSIANTDDVVKITANPAAGYVLKEYDVRSSNDEPITVDADGNFIVPFGGDVIVSGVFWKGYEITTENPFFDGFESGNLNQWTQQSEEGDNTWAVNIDQIDKNRTPYAGSNNTTLRYGNTDWLFTPVYLHANTLYEFEMYARQDKANTSNAEITVMLGRIANKESMTTSLVAKTGLTNGDYQKISGSFTPTETGVYVLGIKGYVEFNDPWYISIDNIKMSIYNNPADHFRSKVSGNWADNTIWESSLDGVNGWASTSLTPSSAAASVNIMSGHLVTVTADATASTLTVSPGAKLTLSADVTLTANTLTLQSDETGTGTFVDEGGTLTATTTNVEQYLTAGRNWYISSPTETAMSDVVKDKVGNGLWKYDEANTGLLVLWPEITVSDESLTVGRGYVANLTSSDAITFKGKLNSGEISTPTLTRNGVVSSGFNLIGNPYPSYLNWSTVNRTDVYPTMWYRTKVGEVYKFYTYLTGSNPKDDEGISVPTGVVTNLIPPMQAFWVRVSAGNTAGSVGFTNDMRAHRDEVTNIFKAPAATKSTRQLVRLQVSNGVNDDETVLYFNHNATNGLDSYDSPKMSHDNAAIPEIYSTAGVEKLVINGMNAIPFDTELAVGFKTGQSNTFTIKATEINNLDGVTKLILKDKILNVEQELALNVPYTFDSEKVNTANRFSLIFRSPSITTGAGNFETASSAFVYGNENRQIVVNCKQGVIGNASVEVYNAVGQKIVSQRLKSTITVINESLLKGVYMVTVINDAKSSTQKVIIK